MFRALYIRPWVSRHVDTETLKKRICPRYLWKRALPKKSSCPRYLLKYSIWKHNAIAILSSHRKGSQSDGWCSSPRFPRLHSWKYRFRHDQRESRPGHAKFFCGKGGTTLTLEGTTVTLRAFNVDSTVAIQCVSDDTLMYCPARHLHDIILPTCNNQNILVWSALGTWPWLYIGSKHTEVVNQNILVDPYKIPFPVLFHPRPRVRVGLLDNSEIALISMPFADTSYRSVIWAYR